MMRAALALARRSLGRTWPNPAVGCVIVKDGQVIARGRPRDGGRRCRGGQQRPAPRPPRHGHGFAAARPAPTAGRAPDPRPPLWALAPDARVSGAMLGVPTLAHACGPTSARRMRPQIALTTSVAWPRACTLSSHGPRRGRVQTGSRALRFAHEHVPQKLLKSGRCADKDCEKGDGGEKGDGCERTRSARGQ